ncbi:class I SAM-dependent methyltransferase [Novosphingobium sp. H3SJ31-1]|uniref:Class I SAM-dependent methyltransferase n=1 Tax=Novosphingobium album (ex Liu et al. 2023) TaxID=3031130 RepID=A0ABT5WW82_9SPHN|nr:class I SAM-dependent methyltransferase [Novosphingobium album (ex Liu et al. 2023)]MDE8654153.1 class I SAM-dependent methyltransferase [Novosphingobium album (ex Liu et al. 2023)]
MLFAGCQSGGRADEDRAERVRAFPRADRPVSGVSASQFSSENERDRFNEAKVVMDLAGIQPGMSIADVGAGDGYYTVRLAQRVGRTGRVVAQDIDQRALNRLGARVERERFDNVWIKPGKPDDPELLPDSFDRIFLVHMYHEVAEPYAFLWNLRPALRRDGRVIVVDSDRSTDSHGIPPNLLFCEFASVGFRLTAFERKPELQGYYAQFEAVTARPAPSAIKPCHQAGAAQTAAS